jgi:large subunit ribosomal protein L6
MSRIGRKIIVIPEKVSVTVDGSLVTVKGPLGELTREFSPLIEVVVADNQVTLNPKEESIKANTLWGTFGSHLQNMVEGVSKGFEKKMIIEGVGYKWSVNGTNVVLDIGFSHDVNVAIPEGVKVVTEKGNMTVSGPDKEKVGSFAAIIRGYKKVEPYKGKGIRYVGEFVRRKQGKKSTA